jgi:ABC-type glutathione transport system ATPase component
MREVTFIVGLPGSGKTTLAKTMVSDGVTFIDDFCVAVKHGHAADLLKDATDRLVITDPKACLVQPDTIREKLTHWGGECKVRFIAFENDVDACWDNVKARDDGRRISRQYLESLAKNYVPSEWGEVRPVYKSG